MEENRLISQYFALKDWKHNSLLIKSGLCIITSFGRIKHEKVGKSNFTVEKLEKHNLGQVNMVNISSD